MNYLEDLINYLDDLAILYGTDKSSEFHNYTKYYFELFEDMRDEKINLLEIGIDKGASLMMWADFFEVGNITGIDINCKDTTNGRITTIKADQRDFKTDQVFDIIIDDGSHNPEHFLKSLGNLWPSLKSGGYYCIEDLSVCSSIKYPAEWHKRYLEWFTANIFNFNIFAKDIDCEKVLIYPKLIVLQKG